MASIFDFTRNNNENNQKNSPSPGTIAYNTYSDNNPSGLYMSSPMNAMEEYGNMDNNVLFKDNDDGNDVYNKNNNSKTNTKTPIYQRMTDRNKKLPKYNSNTGIAGEKIRRYQYQTQEKSSFFSDTEDNEDGDEQQQIVSPPERMYKKNKTLLTQYNEYEGGVSFPLTKSVLWSRRPLCTPIVVPSGCLVPALWISQKALLALGWQMKLKAGPSDYNKSNTIKRNNIQLNCDAFLTGKISFPSRGRIDLSTWVGEQNLNSSLAATESFPIICIDTMDAGLVDITTKTRSPQIPNPSEDEIVIPVTYDGGWNELTDEKFIQRLNGINNIESICNGSGLFHFQCRSSWENETVSVETSVQLPQVAFSFTVIPPIPLFRSIPLTMALLKGKQLPTNDPSIYMRYNNNNNNNSNSIAGDEDGMVSFSHGFLTMNKTRRAVTLMRTDTMKSEYPIIGIWVRLPVDSKTLHSTILNPSASASLQSLLTDPALWSVCLKYLYDTSYDIDRVAPAENTFLLAIFPTHRLPSSRKNSSNMSETSNEELLPLFLEVKKLGDTVGISLPTGTYKTTCYLDTSKENRDRLFENSDTMLQCRFQSTLPLDTDEISSINFNLNRNFAEDTFDNNDSNRQIDKNEGKRMETKYIDDEEDEDNDYGEKSFTSFEEKLIDSGDEEDEDDAEEIAKKNASWGKKSYDEDRDHNYGNYKDDDENDFEQYTPIPQARAPVPYVNKAKIKRTNITNTTSSKSTQDYDDNGKNSVRNRIQVHEPHPTLDSYNHQIIVQQQLQLQMMRNEINNLKKIIEQNGLLSGNNKSVNNNNNNTNNVETRSYMSDDNSDILSMRSIKSFQAANVNVTNKQESLQMEQQRNNRDSQNTRFSLVRVQQEQALAQHDKKKAEDTYERSVMSNLNSQMSEYDDVYHNTDEDVYEHLSKDKISIPNVFESNSKDTNSNNRSKKSLSDWSQISVPKIESSGGSNRGSGGGGNNNNNISGSYVLVEEEEASTFEAPSMTLDANDFSILTQQCLKKYNLVENIDGALKIRSSSSRMALGRVTGSSSSVNRNAFIEENQGIHKDGVEDEEASSDEITDEWDGRILSDVKRLPKFK